jgi:hypothetical protein
MILLVVLDVCGTWCVTLSGEHWLREILEPKRGEETEGWKKLHNE